MIRREVHGDHEPFDVAVVGGGVYGAATAYEAARRGLRALLVERDDFGHATSWNSLRILHGGLRYLQSLDLRRFFESVAERRWWMETFPDLVRPLPCLMPLYGDGLRRPSVFRVALGVNDLLSSGRNRGLPERVRLPAGRVLGRAETLELAGFVRPEGLRGGALWWDAASPDTQRLIVELLHRADHHGATAWNRVEAVGLEPHPSGDGVALTLRDLRAGTEFGVAAAVVVNCAGPWCRDVAVRFDRDVADLFRRSYAFNLRFDRPAPSDHALAVAPPEPGARTYFLHPWKGSMFAGTFHAPWRPGDPTDRVPEDRVDAMVADLRRAVPALDLDRASVHRVTWGFLPATEEGGIELAGRPAIVAHREHGGPAGLYSVSGVKFTTARHVAHAVLRRAWRDRGRSLPDRVAAEGPTDVRDWPDAAAFAGMIEERPERAAELVREIARTESAPEVDDVLLRRTGWSDDPAREAVIRAFVESALGPAVNGRAG